MLHGGGPLRHPRVSGGSLPDRGTQPVHDGLPAGHDGAKPCAGMGQLPGELATVDFYFGSQAIGFIPSTLFQMVASAALGLVLLIPVRVRTGYSQIP